MLPARTLHDCFSSFSDKDVTRTDRTHQFYEGDDNPNIAMMYDILMTYCMYNFDLGKYAVKQTETTEKMKCRLRKKDFFDALL